jgi:hypothetical protein
MARGKNYYRTQAVPLTVFIVVLMSRRLDHSATLLLAKMQKERRE